MTYFMRKIHEIAIDSFLRLPIGIEVKVQPGFSGFFGAVFTTLNGLRLAEVHRKQGRVFWGPSSPYFEASHGENAWTTFFQRSTFDFSERQGVALLSVPYRPGGHDLVPYDGLSVRLSVARALQSWCQPRPEIAQAVARFADVHFGRRPTLGVHVRLTDVAAGTEERRTVNPKSIMQAVDAWLANHQDAGIFLASDDQRMVAAFEQRYPGRVSYQNCLRSQDGTSVHGHYDAGVPGSPYSKGRDVLIDALLLARCSHLIRTHSRVTAFSLCWNPNLTYRDLEQEILGINRTPWLHLG
jgi:hypothetical protein